jgi:hypothetical protein
MTKLGHGTSLLLQILRDADRLGRDYRGYINTDFIDRSLFGGLTYYRLQRHNGAMTQRYNRYLRSNRRFFG